MTAVLVIVTLGAFLRWSTIPVHIAYEIGKRVERIHRSRGGGSR